jgi:NTP pyrophosphatase (non-canonical NTP hydrolase)
MDARAYQATAMRSWQPIPRREGLLLAALGLCGEAAEVLADLHGPVDGPVAVDGVARTDDRARLVTELGDVAWYAALAATLLEEELADWFAAGPIAHDPARATARAAGDRLVVAAGAFADLVKKHGYHAHPFDADALRAPLVAACAALADVCAARGVDWAEVFDRNIEKLAARYPGGWDPARSLHRAD